MIIPCIVMDTEVCHKCLGLGREHIKIYPKDTDFIDILTDKEGECEECEGRGWKVIHEWRVAELI